MRTLTSFIGMGLLTWAAVAATGCGQDDKIDFSQLPLANEAEETELTGGHIFTWVRPGPEQIRCVRAPCPNAFLNDVNLTKTELSYGYDWRALTQSPEEQAVLEADASKMLLYGKYASARIGGEMVQVYQVTRANPRVSEQSFDHPESDSYYAVKAADPACQQPSCGYSATLLNRLPIEQWSSMDLSRLGLPQNALQMLISDLHRGKAYVSVENSGASPVVVTEAFRPYSALPLPND